MIQEVSRSVGRQNYPRRRLHGCRSLLNCASTPSAFKEECRDRGGSLGAQRHRHLDKARFPSLFRRGEKRGEVRRDFKREFPATSFGLGGAGGQVAPPVDNDADFFDWQLLLFHRLFPKVQIFAVGAKANHILAELNIPRSRAFSRRPHPANGHANQFRETVETRCELGN